MSVTASYITFPDLTPREIRSLAREFQLIPTKKNPRVFRYLTSNLKTNLLKERKISYLRLPCPSYYNSNNVYYPPTKDDDDDEVFDFDDDDLSIPSYSPPPPSPPNPPKHSTKSPPINTSTKINENDEINDNDDDTNNNDDEEEEEGDEPYEPPISSRPISISKPWERTYPDRTSRPWMKC